MEKPRTYQISCPEIVSESCAGHGKASDIPGFLPGDGVGELREAWKSFGHTRFPVRRRCLGAARGMEKLRTYQISRPVTVPGNCAGHGKASDIPDFPPGDSVRELRGAWKSFGHIRFPAR